LFPLDHLKDIERMEGQSRIFEVGVFKDTVANGQMSARKKLTNHDDSTYFLFAANA
jgi:hypothetical protein